MNVRFSLVLSDKLTVSKVNGHCMFHSGCRDIHYKGVSNLVIVNIARVVDVWMKVLGS